MSHYVTNFDSWTDYVNHVATVQDSPMWTAEKNTVTSPMGIDFYGGVTMAEAIDLARSGWPEGISGIRAAAGVTAQKQQGKAREYDVAGMYPDAARAAAGDPCAMITPTPGELRAPSVIALIIPCNGLADIKPSSWINRAGAVVTLCDAIESTEDARLELWGFWGTVASSVYRDLFVKIKSAEDPLDMANLAAVCHPSAHRRLNFRMIETFQGHKGHVRSCFCGYGASYPPDDVPEKFLPVANALCLPPINNGLDATPQSSWAAIQKWAMDKGLPVTTA